MSLTSKSPATNQPADDGAAPLSRAQRKNLLAQIHLFAAMKELTELRRTVRLRALGLDEWRQKFSKAGFPAATGWVETVQRLDGEFATRLAKVRKTVSRANQLLTPPV